MISTRRSIGSLRTSAAMFLAFWMTLPAVAAPVDTERLAKAKNLIKKSKHKKAVRMLESVNKAAGGEDAQALLLLADAHLGIGQYPEAIAAARTLVAATQDQDLKGKGSSLLGRALSQSNLETDWAVNRRVIRELALRGSSASSFPDAIGRITQLEQAREALEAAIDWHGDTEPMNYYYLAEVLVSLGRVDEAIASLDKFFEVAGDSDLPLGPRELQCSLRVRQELEVQEVDKGRFLSPFAIEKYDPEYSRKARNEGVQGSVYLAAVITEHGAATCIRPLRGLPMGLTEAAMEALESWKFMPASAAGKSVAGLYKVQLRFGLSSFARDSDVERHFTKPTYGSRRID